MHHKLISALRLVDVRLFYAFSSLFIIPVCLLLNTNQSRTAAYRFFRRRIGQGRIRAAWSTYLNHCRFAEVVIDRFALFAGKRFEVRVEGDALFQRMASRPEGFMMFSSHVGCYEMAGCSLVAKYKRINALVFGGEKAAVMEGRRERLGQNNIRMIPVAPDMSHLFAVNEALVNHEIVSMPADRIIGSDKTVSALLFGGEATLPLGPFAVATLRGLDVLAVNVMKTSTKGYTAFVSALPYDKRLPRKAQIRQLADAYAAELEHCVGKYPTQWYNFYNIWRDNPS